jgi:predicted RNA-binding protein YlxR (DUF448 family)
MQRVRKVPLRKCVGCQELSPKQQLIRVVLTPDEEVALDPTGKMNGRGAYLCRNVDCLKLAMKRHSLERALKTTIPGTVYDVLQTQLSGLNESKGFER